MEKTNVINNGCAGLAWIAGWLFTLGYLQIPFLWKGVLAIILWPYYLGADWSYLAL